MADIKALIRTIEDFPKPGIHFRDVTTLFKDAEGFRQAIDELVAKLEGVEIDVILGTESRGFMLAAPLAYVMNKPFVPIRKAGKLPGETISETYDLEYGTASIEIHNDALEPGMKVVIIDDLLATGGTLAASIKLVEKLGVSVEKILCLIELPALNGREAIKGYDFESLVTFDGD